MEEELKEEELKEDIKAPVNGKKLRTRTAAKSAGKNVQAGDVEGGSVSGQPIIKEPATPARKGVRRSRKAKKRDESAPEQATVKTEEGTDGAEAKPEAKPKAVRRRREPDVLPFTGESMK